MNTHIHNVEKINICINDDLEKTINVNDAIALEVYENGMGDYKLRIFLPLTLTATSREIRKLRKDFHADARFSRIIPEIPETITIKELDGRVHNFRIEPNGFFIVAIYKLYLMKDIQMSYWNYLFDNNDIFPMMLEISDIELIDLGTYMPTGETKQPEPKPEPEVQLTAEQLKFLEQMNQNQPNLDF